MRSRLQKVVHLGGPQPCAWIDVDDVASFILRQRRGQQSQSVICQLSTASRRLAIAGSTIPQSSSLTTATRAARARLDNSGAPAFRSALTNVAVAGDSLLRRAAAALAVEVSALAARGLGGMETWTVLAATFNSAAYRKNAGVTSSHHVTGSWL